MHCANDAESMERLLYYLAEPLRARGYRKIIGPTGLSPHLGSGLLQDYWNITPPLHTPYNPPYLPEISGHVWQARSSGRLYHLPVPSRPRSGPAAPATLTLLNPERLITDLLPLLASACPLWLDFTSPDAKEAAFLLRWLRQGPLWGWLACVGAQPAGFILLQPDLSPRLKLTGGGYNPLTRLWLAWTVRRPVQRGRILFAGVLPDWRGQGIGRQLLHQALVEAQQRGWESVSIGPLPTTAPGSRFLEHLGAQPRQTVLLYQVEL
jgi:ribosomal protein S18 acetylase RimI-like enzyme